MDEANEKEARAVDTINQLKLEIANLSKLVEQGAGLSLGQDSRYIDGFFFFPFSTRSQCSMLCFHQCAGIVQAEGAADQGKRCPTGGDCRGESAIPFCKPPSPPKVHYEWLLLPFTITQQLRKQMAEAMETHQKVEQQREVEENRVREVRKGAPGVSHLWLVLPATSIATSCTRRSLSRPRNSTGRTARRLSWRRI